MNNYRIAKPGQDLVKEFEGLRLRAYKCPAGVLTIGWGHTGSDVYLGLIITEEKAQELFMKDIKRFEDGVRSGLKVEVNQNQFDALVSLAYNIGTEAFKTSSLLRRLNEGNLKAAADQFLVWNKGGGVVLNGLVRRRKMERELFLTPAKIPAVVADNATSETAAKNATVGQTAPTCHGCCPVHCASLQIMDDPIDPIVTPIEDEEEDDSEDEEYLSSLGDDDDGGN